MINICGDFICCCFEFSCCIAHGDIIATSSKHGQIIIGIAKGNGVSLGQAKFVKDDVNRCLFIIALDGNFTTFLAKKRHGHVKHFKLVAKFIGNGLVIKISVNK